MNDFYCDQVLSGKLEIVVVRSTPRVLAFEHTQPMYERHVVVIPRTHVASLAELSDDALLVEMIHVVQEVARDILASDGKCKVITNLGSFQDSKHLHWHVISRPLKPAA